MWKQNDDWKCHVSKNIRLWKVCLKLAITENEWKAKDENGIIMTQGKTQKIDEETGQV